MLLTENLFNMAVRYLVDDNIITEEMLVKAEQDAALKNHIEELVLDMLLNGVLGDK